MNILVLGGAGYIGSILIPMLLSYGDKITVVDNFMYNQTPLLDYCHCSDLEIIRHDVTDYSFMQPLYKERKFDYIIPLACLTGAPLCDSNPVLAHHVIKRSIEDMVININKDTRIIYPTTNSGYGVGEKNKLCTEETPLNPISLYGKLKCEAENIILKNCNSISLRLATAFGLSPRMRLDLLVNDFVYRAVYDKNIVIFEGKFRRNFIHVRDIASAICHCMANWQTMKNEVYNVGLSSANITKLQLAKEVKKFLPQTFIIESKTHKDPDKRDYIVSNEKLEKTGWLPRVSLQQGIEELIKGYKIIKRREFSNV